MDLSTITLLAENTPAQPWRERWSENRLHRCVFPLFTTEAGTRLVNLQLAYRVFGQLNAQRDNVILVFHALTGDANCAGYQGHDGWVPGWWEGLFGSDGIFTRDRWCVVCANHPGGCYGSSGPLDVAVGHAEPLGLDYPVFTPRDLARVNRMLLDHLGLSQLFCCLGGSLGGMVALEFMIMFPGIAANGIAMATSASGDAQALAFSHIQRKCLEADPHFRGGRYYGGQRPTQGLSLARQVAMITYRSAEEFSLRFGRKSSYLSGPTYFEVQHYLDHQGDKLVRRFDANSYVKLLDALDAHDIFRDRGHPREVLRCIEGQLLLLPVTSDSLYTPAEIRQLYQLCLEAGVSVYYDEIESLRGHDGFLVEAEQVNELIQQFLEDRLA